MKKIEPEKYISNTKGFTLLELIVVMVILGLLAALIGTNYIKKSESAKVKAAKVQIEMLGQALDSYRLDTGNYPTTSEGLNALITDPGVDGWDGPYLRKNLVPKDPWGKPFHYQSPGTHGEYDLFSYGKDNTQGGEGYGKDINSWE